MLVSDEYCPFKTTLCYLKFKKSVMISVFLKCYFVLVCTRALGSIPYQMLLKCLLLLLLLFINIYTGLVLQYKYCYQYTSKNVKNYQKLLKY